MTCEDKACCTGSPHSEADSRAVRRLQYISIAWMSLEVILGIGEGIRARSVALTAFGADSLVELISALVVLRRFQVGPAGERRAAFLSAILLYIIAVYIVTTSTLGLLVPALRPEASGVGIVLLLIAAIGMPLLGKAKRRLAQSTASAALQADAAQTSICAYMAWIGLGGLLANAIFHVAWADSVAALLLLPLVLREANRARRGELCTCD